MRKKFKSVLIILLLLVTVFLITGCSEENQYAGHDAKGFNVSVRFDANGGEFTASTYVITDAFNIEGMPTNSDGKVELSLIAPDNSIRGEGNIFRADRAGYFVVGWYTNRDASTDENGNTVYTYSGRWDFEKDTLKVDPNEAHSASDPVVTLYAVWAPLFEINFYNLDDGQLLDTKTFNPLTTEGFEVPVLEEGAVTVDMKSFPRRNNYTFKGAYYDAGKTQPITDRIVHTGAVDEATGVVTGHSMDVYVDWTEGNWYHIYSLEQFTGNANLNGNYILHTDLDFTDAVWPSTFSFGTFNGSIRSVEGQHYAIRNISITQTDANKINGGLFGELSETAALCDITFENITFTLKKGTHKPLSAYGLLAGILDSDAQISGVQIKSSRLEIDSGCRFNKGDQAIGLICGIGDSSVVSDAQIECVAVGKNPEKVQITVEGNEVILVFS